MLRGFVVVGAAVGGLLAYGQSVLGADSEKDLSRPNVVVLFIDDLAYGDIGAYGAPDIPTPNIDSIVTGGAKFMNAYTACPVCSPSRAALMTGLYPQRFGVNGNLQRGQPLPKDHPTLAETLKKAGYVTGMVGRWDMGSADQGPLDRGFDLVMREQTLPQNDPGRATPTGPTYILSDGRYLTDVQGERMAEFVDRHSDKTFFLYFAPLAVHYPLTEVPQSYLDRVPAGVPGERVPRSGRDGDRTHLAATLIALDDAIGKLLEALRRNGLEEKTIIFFTGDNGGSLHDNTRNLPWRGGKATFWNGAVHEPFAVQWAGTIPAGTTIDGLTSTLDIYPTAAAAADAPVPEDLDGVNLLPFLTGKESGEPHEALFWRWKDQWGDSRKGMKAVRAGKWRWIESPIVSQLSNLEADPGETTDLSKEHPEVVEELKGMLAAWEAQMPPYKDTKKRPSGRMLSGDGWASAEEWQAERKKAQDGN